MKQPYNKITVGFVVQRFEEGEDGKFHAVSQNFTAGDQVDYEDTTTGDPTPVNKANEVYCSYNMEKPPV